MIVGSPGLLLLAAIATASPSPDEGERNPYLAQALTQIRQFDEAGALKTLERARTWAGNKPRELAQVHLVLGLAHAGLVHSQQAVENFRTGLLLDPALTLPDDASPRIRQWWIEAGGHIPAHDADVPVRAPAEPPLAAPPVTVTPTAPPTQPLTTEARASRGSTLTWISFGVGAAALVVAGVGVGLGVDAQSASSQAQSSDDVGAAKTLQQRAVSEAHAANGLYAAAGVTAVIAAIVFIVSRVRG